MECFLLRRLPINTVLLLVCQDFHFTNTNNLPFLISYRRLIHKCPPRHKLIHTFIKDAIRMANPFWHLSSFVCHSHESSQVGQTQRNALSILPECTPGKYISRRIVASQNMAFLWTTEIHSYSAFIICQIMKTLILSRVYSNDEKPANFKEHRDSLGTA